jgi:hypothetical protein
MYYFLCYYLAFLVLIGFVFGLFLDYFVLIGLFNFCFYKFKWCVDFISTVALAFSQNSPFKKKIFACFTSFEVYPPPPPVRLEKFRQFFLTICAII